MAVLLGCEGYVELRRSSQNEAFVSEVRPSDVNANADRFSFDFPQGMLLTGDQIEIKALDGNDLGFIDASGWAVPGPYPDGVWYIFIDEVSGIRLYQSFDDAVSGEVTGRVPLVALAAPQPIAVRVLNNIDRIVGQVVDFELNNSREAVDVSELGEEFRQQHATMISGSGQLTCFFDYERRPCDGLGIEPIEMPIYMHSLLLRTQLGSGFRAKLTLVGRGPKPGGNPSDFDDEVWYEFDALVTNVGIAFEPTQPIRTTIQYVTTGEIQLRVRTISNYILQEQGAGDRIRLEANQYGFLEKEQEE